MAELKPEKASPPARNCQMFTIVRQRSDGSIRRRNMVSTTISESNSQAPTRPGVFICGVRTNPGLIPASARRCRSTAISLEAARSISRLELAQTLFAIPTRKCAARKEERLSGRVRWRALHWRLHWLLTSCRVQRPPLVKLCIACLDAAFRHQFGNIPSRIKQACLHRARRRPDDFCYLIY